MSFLQNQYTLLKMQFSNSYTQANKLVPSDVQICSPALIC